MILTSLYILKWLKAFYGRLAFAVTGMLVVLAFPRDGVVSTGYFLLVIASTVFNSFMRWALIHFCIICSKYRANLNHNVIVLFSTVQFVSISAFFTTIADPVIGGTYMTVSYEVL